VDNLDDVGKLEEAVASAANFIIFLSKGYFASKNCRRELYAALAADKPMIAVQEADKDKGGADIDELKEECRQCCTSEDATALAFSTFPGSDEVLKQVFGEQQHDMPIVWVRVHDFQIASLKEVVLRLLQHSSYYKSDGHDEELASGLLVPGEIGPYGFKSPITLLVCSANEGAWRIAQDVQAASMEGRQAIGISLEGADTVVNEHSKASQAKTAMLLYLTKDTFLDSDGKVAAAVQQALDLNISIALVAEQDVSRGGCPFSVFFDQTPKHLQVQPYCLFNELAVPYYPSPVHCTISRRHVLRKMGAEELRLPASGMDETPEAGAAVHPDPDPETGSLAGNTQSPLAPQGATADCLPLDVEELPLSSDEVEVQASSRQLTAMSDQLDDEQKDRRTAEDPAKGCSAPPSSPFICDRPSQRNRNSEAGPREAPSISHIGLGNQLAGGGAGKEGSAVVCAQPGGGAVGAAGEEGNAWAAGGEGDACADSPSISSAAVGSGPQGYLKVHAMQVILSSH
jgi:hypothetical protein